MRFLKNLQRFWKTSVKVFPRNGGDAMFGPGHRQSTTDQLATGKKEPQQHGCSKLKMNAHENERSGGSMNESKKNTTHP